MPTSTATCRAQGPFLNDRETLVQAVTEHGGGLLGDDAASHRRGLHRAGQPRLRAVRHAPRPRDAAGQVAGETAVTGLLRISEPQGGFLRSNDPAGDRWYSRDVDAIAAAAGSGRSRPISSMRTPRPIRAAIRSAG